MRRMGSSLSLDLSLVACIAIAFADALTTHAVLSVGAGLERGLVVGLLVSAVGLIALPLYAPVEALTMYLALRLLKGLGEGLGAARGAEYAFLLPVALVPINNLAILLSGIDLPSLFFGA